jgi:hypothetical protein
MIEKIEVDDSSRGTCFPNAKAAIAVHYCYSAQSIRMGRPSRSLPFSVAAFWQASVFQNSTKPLDMAKTT